MLNRNFRSHKFSHWSFMQLKWRDFVEHYQYSSEIPESPSLRSKDLVLKVRVKTLVPWTKAEIDPSSNQAVIESR